MLRILILSILMICSCGFEDNMPCRSDDCEDNPEELPKSDDEG